MATAEQIARKRLAGQGKAQEPGTVFGSKWTENERTELTALVAELGRDKAAKQFAELHPHRTVAGALYQIDRNLSKAASAPAQPAEVPVPAAESTKAAPRATRPTRTSTPAPRRPVGTRAPKAAKKTK